MLGSIPEQLIKVVLNGKKRMTMNADKLFVLANETVNICRKLQTTVGQNKTQLAYLARESRKIPPHWIKPMLEIAIAIETEHNYQIDLCSAFKGHFSDDSCSY